MKKLHIAHSIKGSSGNFRIESLQHNASESGYEARAENSEYDYEEVFEKIRLRIQEISIS